jgi:hypothetical protein
LSDQEHEPHDTVANEQLLRELDELRKLDRRRSALAPGSPAHDAATLEVDLRSRRLMDRFRDLKGRRSEAGGVVDREWTRPLDPREKLSVNRAALRN